MVLLIEIVGSDFNLFLNKKDLFGFKSEQEKKPIEFLVKVAGSS